jgi:glutathione S-transferase
MDTELKNKKYLVGDNMTIADLIWMGDIIMLKFANFDFGRLASLRKWKELMEKSKTWTTIQADIDALVKDFNLA